MNGQQEAHFMGRISAAMTHEMKNILAVIKESLGLLDDLASFSEDVPVEQYREWIRKSISIVTDQVTRGINLIQQFNKFAHIPDHSVLQINVSDSIAHLISLCGHLVKLRQVRLDYNKPEIEIPLTTSPLYAYMIIFIALDKIMSSTPANSTISIAVKQQEETVFVEFKILPPENKSIPKECFQPPTMKGLLNLLGGSYNFDRERLSITLSLKEIDPDTFLKELP